MRQILYSLLLILMINSWPNTVQAQTKPVNSEASGPSLRPEPAPVLAKNLQGLSHEAIELQTYKLLYQDAKDANNRIIQTLQWSVGLGTAFLLALAGSQIFFNYRLGKEEIAFIKSNNEKFITELLEKSRFEYAQKFLNLENIVENRRNEIMSIIDRQNNFSKNQFESFTKKLNSEITDIKIDLEKATGQLWRLRGVESNALSKWVAAALLEIESGSGDARYILEDIASVLGQLDDIYVRDYETLNRLLPLISEDLSGIRDNIRKLFIDKPVYEFLENPDPVSGKKYRYIKNHKT